MWVRGCDIFDDLQEPADFFWAGCSSVLHCLHILLFLVVCGLLDHESHGLACVRFELMRAERLGVQVVNLTWISEKSCSLCCESRRSFGNFKVTWIQCVFPRLIGPWPAAEANTSSTIFRSPWAGETSKFPVGSALLWQSNGGIVCPWD